MAVFAFSDLKGFRDYVGFVKLCAPDMFPPRTGVDTCDQWTLPLAFKGLWHGFELLSEEGHFDKSPILESCLALTKDAEKCYQSGDTRGGFIKLQQIEQLLEALRPE